MPGLPVCNSKKNPSNTKPSHVPFELLYRLAVLKDLNKMKTLTPSLYLPQFFYIICFTYFVPRASSQSALPIPSPKTTLTSMEQLFKSPFHSAVTDSSYLITLVWFCQQFNSQLFCVRYARTQTLLAMFGYDVGGFNSFHDITLIPLISLSSAT